MKKKRNYMLPGIMFLSLIGAISVYVVMLNMERKMLEGYEKKECIICKEAVLQGKMIRNEDEYYFEKVEIDQRMVPEGALTDIDGIIGSQSVIPIAKGQVITKEMFQTVPASMAELKEPVIAGVSAEDLYQVVNGTVRSGDLVNLYTVDEESGEVSLFWEGVWVKETFDSNGTHILPEDQETSASRMNLVLEKAIVDRFYELLDKGSLRMVKEWGDSF